MLCLEPAPRLTDMVYDVNGVTVLVDPRRAEFISGMTLDYSTANLLEGGCKYINPNVQKSCRCGTSFTPKQPSYSVAKAAPLSKRRGLFCDRYGNHPLRPRIERHG